jgi:hypothetical protein
LLLVSQLEVQIRKGVYIYASASLCLQTLN